MNHIFIVLGVRINFLLSFADLENRFQLIDLSMYRFFCDF